MTDKHKTRLKFGDFEFEAEGDKASVEEQLKQFLAIVEKSTAGSPVAPKVADPIKTTTDGTPAAPRPLEGVFDRVFKLEGKLLSLRVLPKTKAYAADALLVLLYGFHEVVKESEVLAGDLMKSGKQSGLQLDRVDRVLEPHSQLIDTGGARKGRRYRLNNPGIEKAKEIMKLMTQ